MATSNGHSTTQTDIAPQLLIRFEASLRDNIKHRDRMRAGLDALDPIG